MGMYTMIFSLNSLVILFVEFSFWDNGSCDINHTIRISWYQRIHMQKYFSKWTVCISCVSVVFQKSGFFFFYPNILSCVEINLFKFRSQVKIHHVSEVWINFTTQLGLFIKIWTENTFFTCGREVENYRLNRYKYCGFPTFQYSIV